MWSFILRCTDSPACWRLAAVLISIRIAFRPSARWYVTRGYCREQGGLVEKARADYEMGLDRARTSETTASQRWFHPAQFFLERAYALRDTPRVHDPLFGSSILPANCDSTGPVAKGFFKAEFVYSGLRIMGYVQDTDATSVTICLDDTEVRTIRLRERRIGSTFTMTLFRPVLDTLPQSGTLSVLHDGIPLATVGFCAGLELKLPHGTGTFGTLISRGGRVTKKGTLTPPADEIRRHQDAYLHLYSQARDTFDDVIDTRLFIFYGTLLGFYREHDLIKDDDDFDVGYISRASDPVTVKNETRQIIRRVLQAGFDVSFNSQGRLFRIQSRSADTSGVHIDVRPIWFQEGRVWAHNHFSMPATSEDYLPAGTGELRGTKVYTPRNIEKFLVGQYGEGWKVPDPGFVYHRDSIDTFILNNLARALITPSEFREWNGEFSEMRRENPNAGRFVSLAVTDMYPLEDTDLDFE